MLRGPRDPQPPSKKGPAERGAFPRLAARRLQIAATANELIERNRLGLRDIDRRLLGAGILTQSVGAGTPKQVNAGRVDCHVATFPSGDLRNLAVSIPAEAGPDPAAFINNLACQLQVVARNTSAEERQAGFRELLHEDFDVPSLGRFVLGRPSQIMTVQASISWAV